MAQESRLAIVVDSKTSEEQVKALAEALRILEGAGVRVTGVSEETSKRFQSLAQDAGKSSRGISDLGKTANTAASSLTGMATALASVVSTAKLFGQIQNSMQAAARFEQLGLIVEVMGRNAGIAAHELVELEKELQKTGISMTQSRQVIAQLVQANIDLSHATNLARLAQDAATIAGIGSSEALGRLITGIQTSQVEILRNMGVVVSFENSYKSLADQLGRTTASLSESEKMAARVNAVLEQGGAIAGSYEISMTNALKQAGSMVRLQEDLNVLMGQMYQPAYSAAIEGMSATIKEAQGHAQVLSVALAGVTAAAATATVGVLAFSKSFGVLRIAMNAIAAHPVMMVLSVAVGVATALGVAFSHAGRDARTAAIDMDELTRSLRGLNAEQLAFRQQQAEEKLASLEESAAEAARELKALEKDYAELVKMFEEGRGVDAEGLENLNKTLVEQRARVADANQEVEKARGVLAKLDEAARAAAGGVQTLNDTLAQTNEAGKTYLERLADQAITAGLKTQREQLEALVAAGKLVYTPEDLEKARKHADHIDRMNASLRTGTRATNELASAIESLVSTHLPHVAALNELHKNLALLDKAQKAGIVTGQNYVKALESINKAYAEQVKSLLPESIKKVQEQVKAARDQERQLRQQVRTFGLAESAVLALAAADTDAAIAKLEATKASEIADGASVERIKHIEAEIQALRELRDLQLNSAGLQGQIEWKEAQRQQWEDWARDVEQIFNRVGQSLTDAIFDGGKSGRDLLRDLFKGLTFNILINPVMNQMQGWVTNQLGGLFGLQQPAGGGMFGLAQNASSLHSAFTGGFTDTLASGVNWLGEKLGSSALQSFAAGMSGAFTATSPVYAITAAGLTGAGATALPASLAIGPGLQASLGTTIGTAGAGAGAATAGGAASAGSMFAAAAPWVLGGLAVASAFGLFDDRLPTTRRSQQGASHMLPDGSWEVSSWDDRQDTASQIAARDFAQAAVKHANDLFERIGIDAQIHSFQTLMESSILGDKQGVGSSGQVRIGDVIRDIGLTVESSWTRHGFGGWSDQPMLPRLQTDIQLTILEAFQAVGDELPTVLSDMLADVDIRSLGAEQAQALAQSFQLVVDQVSALQVALEQLPFEQLRDLSFDAAANLIQFAGGLEQLDAGMTAYFQNFYSEAERLDWLSKQVSGSLSELGLVMPDVTQGADEAKSAWRAIVESLDVTTEEGQRAYATMMTLSGSFAQLVTGMDQLSDATQRAHQELLNSLMGEVNAALSAVQQRGQERIAKLSESFARTDAVFDAYRSQVQALESQWGSLISTMDRSMRDLRGQVEASARLQYNQARAVISTALLTGQLPQTADLGEAIRVAQQGVTGGRYASAFDQREAYLKLANELEALQGIAKPELDAAQASLEQLEKQYNRLRGIEDLSGLSLKQLEKQFAVALSAEEAARTQISQIERQIAMAQAQYHELVGINDELSTLPGALQALAKAINAAAAAQQAQQQQQSGAQRSRELQYLADNPDVMAQYGQHGRGMSLEEYARLHYDLYGRKEGRAFARGGFATPGWALVGEEGPELVNFSQPGRVYTADQTNDILRSIGAAQNGNSQREMVAEMRQMREENRKLAQYNYQMLKELIRIKNNTEDTAMAVAHGESEGAVVIY